MKILQFIIFLTLIINIVYAQKLMGKWKRTETQIKNLPIDPGLIGKWESSVNNPLLSFYLNEDGTFKWISDTIHTNSDSIFWTIPKLYWTTKDSELNLVAPTKEKNIWAYTTLGVYYLNKNKLYLGSCFNNIADLKSFIKNKEWQAKKDACAHELIKRD